MNPENSLFHLGQNHFNSLCLHKSKVGNPTKITVNGHQIKLSSGKALWKRIGDAKTALRNEVNNFFDSWSREYMTTKNLPRYDYVTGSYEGDKELKEKFYQYVLANVVR